MTEIPGDQDQAARIERLRRARERLGERRPVDIPVAKVPDPLPTDDKSVSEAHSIAAGSLEEDAARNDHRRNESFRNAVSWATLIIFWLAVVAIVIAGVCWFWHLMTPEKLHFLEPRQSEKVGSLLLGGVMSNAVSAYAKKRLGF